MSKYAPIMISAEKTNTPTSIPSSKSNLFFSMCTPPPIIGVVPPESEDNREMQDLTEFVLDL